jgi:hypothetical protein
MWTGSGSRSDSPEEERVSDDDRYDCEVKEGALSMRDLRNTLNDRWKDGWALHTVLTQGGNTVIVYARTGR